MPTIDFWFSIGSTYTYLTVMRICDVAHQADVEIRYRPFNVRTIMIEQDNIPFANKPVKTAYMWRDIERRAAGYGLPIRTPAPYPLQNLELANRIAILGLGEGWGDAYIHETYRFWFQEGHPAGDRANLDLALAAAGQPAGQVIGRAGSAEVGAELVAQTRQAKSIGVFGSPTFVVDGEVFWGDDRLDDAVAWAKNGRLAAPA